MSGELDAVDEHRDQVDVIEFARDELRELVGRRVNEGAQQNAISPDTRLTSRYRPSERRADTRAVLEAIQDANYDERKRRESLGLRGGPPADRAP